MSEVWQRILLAAFLSIAGCLITYALTTSSSSSQSQVPTEDPVAVIISSENEVQRRPSERLVWRRVFDNQLLYAGEAIRTEVGSTVTLQFINRNTIVQLDPETVVEIERGEGGLNLDFLRGNLFIRAGEGEAALTLSSGEKKLEIQNAEVSFSKTDANANLQVEVNKGDVKGTEKVEQRIELLSPLPRQVIYVSPEQDHKVLVQWNGIPESYSTSLELGESPQRLEKQNDLKVEGQKVELFLKPGRYYFRLSAIDPTGKLPPMNSFTRRIELRPKLPPITLEPPRGAKVAAGGDKPTVDFRWANPGKLENLVFEYARSADLRVDHATERLKSALTIQIALRWNSGDIFWRVSGTIPGTKDVVASKVSKFTLQSGAVEAPVVAVMTPVPTPVATPTPSPSPVAQVSPSPSPTATPTPEVARSTPRPKLKISSPSIDESVSNEGIIGKTDGSAQVNWKPVSEAKQYQVQVTDAQGQVLQTTKVNGTSTNLTNLKTGEYKVTLNSIDKAGELSTAKTEINLKIPEYSSVRAPKIKSMSVK